MTNLFNNYDKYNTTIPDNRYKFLVIEPDYKDVIIKGAQVTHCFKIPYDIEDIEDISVTFFQGIEQKLIIPNYRIELKNKYSENDNEDISKSYCWAYYTVLEDESLLFNTYNKQVNVQLQIVLTNDKIEYSPIYKIKVVPTLFTMDEDTNDGRVK